MKDSNEAPLPSTSYLSEDKLIKDGLTICPECSSPIEILLINEENNAMEYKCLKTNKINTISIKDYLDKINECKQKNIEELKEKCKIHKNENYVSYCFECNCHLCNECLKTRIHINHRKSNIVEIKPLEKELDIVKEVIEDYKIKLEETEKEKINKTNELEKLLNKEKIKEDEKLEKENKMNKDEEEKELEENKINYLNEIEEIRKRFENEIKSKKQIYEEKNNMIKNKYKLINEKERVKYELNIEKLNDKYKKEINKYEFNKKIENLDKILKINEIVYNIYNNYNNNYYNSLNVNSLLMYYIKSKYINEKIIKVKLDNNYDEIIKIIKQKRIEDKKIKEENERIEKEKMKVEENYKNEINELKNKITQNILYNYFYSIFGKIKII